ncbi:hypothetical protein AB0C96_14630 [Streptomyces sp. NPDC048506]|uniref:hypothetical protein n=1 Tax=Streptomyces sp. NPDC048506 TaxID=3155028 RepID=UPI003414CB9B
MTNEARNGLGEAENDQWRFSSGRQFGAVEETMLRLDELLFPSVADVTALSVDVRDETVRFFCLDAACGRRTFVEQVPGLTRRYSRWTERLRSTLAMVGLALAGRAGARMASVFGVSVSRSTVLRLVDLLPEPDAPAPRVVGVDEYATRKGRVYGTVLVDVEGRRPVDLLSDREASSLAKWLAKRPGVDDRWNEGCTNAWKLWEEIIPLGYKGSYGIVTAYFREKRTSPRPVTARPPSPRAVAVWILRRPESLTDNEQLQLKAVLAECPELDALTRHVRSFARMLTERQGERLPQWLDAVIAGLPLPWNSGVVEGHINRIEMFKGQMFGRAGFRLLRKRVLLA